MNREEALKKLNLDTDYIYTKEEIRQLSRKIRALNHPDTKSDSEEVEYENRFKDINSAYLFFKEMSDKDFFEQEKKMALNQVKAFRRIHGTKSDKDIQIRMFCNEWNKKFAACKTIFDLKSLYEEYKIKKRKMILFEKDKQKVIDESKKSISDILNDIKQIKAKYIDDKDIQDLCNRYFEDFLKINVSDKVLAPTLIKVKKDSFNKEIGKLKQQYNLRKKAKAFIKEIEILKQQKAIENSTGKESAFEKFFDRIKEEVSKCATIQEIEVIEKSFKDRLESFTEQLKHQNQFNLEKMTIKGKCLSKFCEYARSASLENINLALKLLERIIIISNTIETSEELHDFMGLINDIDYSQLDHFNSKIDLYEQEKNRNIKFFSENGIGAKKLIDSFEVPTTEALVVSDNLFEREKLKIYILEQFQLIYSKTSFDNEEVLIAIKSLKKVLECIYNMSNEEILKKISFLKTIDVYDFIIEDRVDDFLTNFSLEGQIFISFKNGKYYEFERRDDKVIGIPLDLNEEEIELKSETDLLNFTNISTFFKSAMFVNSYDILEIDRSNKIVNTHECSNNVYSGPLYLYDNLMLYCWGFGFQPDFTVIVPKNGCDFELGKKRYNYIIPNSNNRDIVKEQLLNFIINKYNLDKRDEFSKKRH